MPKSVEKSLEDLVKAIYNMENEIRAARKLLEAQRELWDLEKRYLRSELDISDGGENHD